MSSSLINVLHLVAIQFKMRFHTLKLNFLCIH
nr:MAG TPA: hypothetical protein [Caudoviricetes sp.]